MTSEMGVIEASLRGAQDTGSVERWNGKSGRGEGMTQHPEQAFRNAAVEPK
jgi:hypothetical protein